MERWEQAHKSWAARTIPITGADEFFQTLQQRVETLEKSQRQNPLSVDLLVSSTKRYLAKPEHRIQLDELFSQETERLLGQLDDDIFSTQGQWSQESFRTRVVQYESVTEPLARMVGVLGRWGDGRDFDVVFDVLRNLYHHAVKVGGGLTHWLNLRSYPAVLIFTAYGIGLTKAARWDMLLKLFSSTLAAEHREPQRIVSTLFIWSWVGGGKELWQLLEGKECHKTPLSDHLLEVMMSWRKSFSGADANFELLFERFELMGALAAFQENDEALLEEAFAASATRNNGLPWIPVGRLGWHNTGARALLLELEDKSRIDQLLQAGFAKGSRRFLQIFVENFKLHVRRMSW